jgi:hypothetical protein
MIFIMIVLKFMFYEKLLNFVKKVEKMRSCGTPLQMPGFWPIFWGPENLSKKSIFFVIFC